MLLHRLDRSYKLLCGLHINILLATHGSHQNSMVRSELVKVCSVFGRALGRDNLHLLRHEVLGDRGNDLAGVLFLGVDPPGGLIQRKCVFQGD